MIDRVQSVLPSATVLGGSLPNMIGSEHNSNALRGSLEGLAWEPQPILVRRAEDFFLKLYDRARQAWRVGHPNDILFAQVHEERDWLDR